MQFNIESNKLEPIEYWYTVLPEIIYPSTKILPQTIPHSCLDNDTACQNFIEVLPRFALVHNTAVNSKMR